MSKDNTPQTNEEILAECRAKCRELETMEFETEAKFRYAAREPWWEYSERSQKLVDHAVSFREFWGNEETYPRTIAID